MTLLMAILGFISMFFMMHGMLMLTAQYYGSGTVWGCSYKGKGNALYAVMAIVGLVVLIAGFWLIADNMWDSWDTDEWLMTFMIFLGIGIVASIPSSIIARNKFYASDNISKAIAAVPFMPELERYAAQAHHFTLEADKILFFDNTNYNIGTIAFVDYQLGNLTEEQRRAGAYGIVQKLNSTFACRISSGVNEYNVSVRSYEFVRK